MKRFTRYMVIALATVAAVACTKDDEAVTPAVMQKITFTAEAPVANDASRAGYNSTVGAHWDAGDEVVVNLSDDNLNITFSQQAGSLSNNNRTVVYEANTDIVPAEDYDVTAIYLPAQTRAASASRITLPANQTYVENGYTKIPLIGKAPVSVNAADGKVSIGAMVFQNYFAILKLNLKGDVTVKKIEISDNDNVVIAGKVIVYPKNNNTNKAVVSKWDGAADKTITLDCGTGVALNSEDAKAFHIVVPSKNLHESTIFANGCKITIYTNAGQISKTTKGMGELEENTIYNTPELTLSATEAKKIVPDATFRGWLADNGFVTAVNNETGEVTIVTGKKSLEFTGNDEAKSVEGVQYFTELTKLRLFNLTANTDTTIDVSMMPELAEFYCYSSNLKSLDVTKNTKLAKLRSHSNYIENLDISNLPDGATLQVGSQKGSIQMQLYIREGQNYTLESNNNSNLLTPIVVK